MNNEKLIPRYKHDCKDCTLIGMYLGYDLYVSGKCNLGIPTIVARYGDDGPGYLSGWDNGIPALRIGQMMTIDLEKKHAD